MGTLWCDPKNGNDSNDGSTHALAKQNPQSCIDLQAGGDELLITNSAKVTLSGSGITLNTLGATAPDTPYRIRAVTDPVDPDGTLVYTLPGGGTVPCFEFDANSSATYCINSTGSKSYVAIEGGRFKNSTNWLVYHSSGWALVDCEFIGGSGTYQVYNAGNGKLFYRCTFRDTVGASTAGLYASAADIVGCKFENIGGIGISGGAGAYGTIRDCLFNNVQGDNVTFTNKDFWGVFHNSFYNTGDDNIAAVRIGTTNSEINWVINNIFEGFSGMNSCAVKIDASSGSIVLGPNAFFNNTAKVTNNGNPHLLDRTAGDLDLLSSPFVNPGGGDFRVDSTSPAFKGAPVDAVSQYQRSFGAVQEVNQSGGGGGGTIIRAC